MLLKLWCRPDGSVKPAAADRSFCCFCGGDRRKPPEMLQNKELRRGLAAYSRKCGPKHKIKRNTDYFCGMILTDTHTHLYSEEFAADRAQMLERAMDAGVKRFFLPGIDSSCMEAMHALQEQYPDNIFLMAGLHPVYVKENYEAELEQVRQALLRGSYVAVGEIGIDLYWDKSTLAWQQHAFREQIKLAKEHRLPINIHCRDAFDEIFEILEAEQAADLRGIFHCFTGSYEQALRAIDCGMKLGIGGVVTFKNGKIDQFLHRIDIGHIVTETDAPYLAPAPYRGKRNESAYIRLIASKLAEIYGLSLEEIARITTKNAADVYGI